MSKGSRLINRQAVTQPRPFGCLLAAQFESEFLPLSGLVGRRDGNTLEGSLEILTFQSIPGRRPLEKLSQRHKERLPREGLANVAAELALQLRLFAGLARSSDGDDRQRHQARLLADLRQGRSPVHHRHSNIEQYHIGLCLLQTRQRFPAVVGKMDLVMGLLEYASHVRPDWSGCHPPPAAWPARSH